MARRARLIGRAVLLTTVVALIAGVAPLTPAQADTTVIPAECSGLTGQALAHGVSLEQLKAGFVSVLGQEVPLDLPTLDLSSSPFTDPSRTLWWQSFIWMTPVALYVAEHPPALQATSRETAAQDDGDLQPTPELIAGSSDPIGDLVAAMNRSPDPGSKTKAALDKANSSGWDEGTNFRREQTLNCLFAATRDPRLLPALTATVNANKDAKRYYGPPLRPIHNHGTMANATLRVTARLLGSTPLDTFAITRIRDSMKTLFSPTGFTYEQSSMYHLVHLSTWALLRQNLGQALSKKAYASLDDILGKARTARDFLTSPTGLFVSLGDGQSQTLAAPVRRSKYMYLDRDSGLASARWSWTDPDTTWYTVRFGPKRSLHGHYDHGSVTWQTLGTPVLIDPGSYTYDNTNSLWSWQRSARAHNSTTPSQATLAYRASPLTQMSRNGQIDTVRVTNNTFTARTNRMLRLDNKNHSLTVQDDTVGEFTQHFHFDPCWSLTEPLPLPTPTPQIVPALDAPPTAVTVTLQCGLKRLTVSSSAGAVFESLTGSLDPIGGWIFPAFEQKTAGLELLITGTSKITTVLTAKNS